MNSTEAKLELLLRQRGILSAGEAVGALGVSQPTLSRAIAAAGPRKVVRFGRGRATRYGLRRTVRGLGNAWPLYCVAEDGNVRHVARMHALEARYWFVEQGDPWDSLRGSEFRDGLYPGLPWFLQDTRPQGFLGRCFARKVSAELGTPSDPRDWSDDDMVTACLRRGDDLPGSFVVGEAMLEAVQTRSTGISGSPAADPGRDYARYADSVLGGEWPGSSAAGEQPKFTTCVGDTAGAVRQVIVKFSGKANRPEDRRWADLLAAENTANVVLSELGIPCASTRIVEAGGRTFLESQRFDRSGARGRRGLVSLAALDAAFFGEPDTPWTVAAARLRTDGWLNGDDADRLCILWWFGVLIGNTDMHYGNISLFLTAARPLPLAPTYDMTCMFYRPNIEGTFTSAPLSPPPPPPEAIPLWSRAAQAAARFWERMAGTDTVSPAFRQVCASNAEVLAELRARVGA